MIQATDWAGVLVRLVHKSTGEPVKEREAVESSRSTVATVLSGTPPHKESSTGRVYVQFPNQVCAEFYPNVFDLEWRKAYEINCTAYGFDGSILKVFGLESKDEMSVHYEKLVQESEEGKHALVNQWVFTGPNFKFILNKGVL